MPNWLLYILLGVIAAYILNCLFNLLRDRPWYEFSLLSSFCDGLAALIALLLP